MRMKNDKLFVKILQSPCCGKTLKSTNELKCQKCGSVYSYKNNIPILITKTQLKEDAKNIKTAKDSRFNFEENKFIKSLFPPSDTLRIVNKENSLIRKLPKNGIALSIGSEIKSKKVINLDINPDMDIDIVADITSLPFKDNSLDLVICQYVLEHVKDIKKAVSEINRVLTPNGLVYISMPFLQLYHPSPSDYNRLTLDGLRFLMKNFHEVETGIGIGPASALAWILREFIASFFDNKFLHRITLFITGWLIFPLKYLDLFLVKKKHAYILASSFYYIGKKN
ncbi:MAG: hypothetical protein UR11_C0002G0247 [Candidatus Woesebacteria bacterium GW2011_GWC1_30_29]|uniref:Methyltransferase type 11 domain-containing protein n=1 Tax=Candidatus Woesebacteria bacterium GW2011_GWC2_31_9 TaxID=1618586 RepID=A0A0F9Z0Q3_9BACT|nr:MAG: hypothetical protein UR11_C0002G0247 [Candidatus Woesebacteria bacterium GW2011_GWC1_30_29]KKP26645.1 MAG: hypothetical protein UR13_C0003G0012 [Candidatus Woesebacteria bacterium GW2011_GWD1_31_12]KKP28115.1 MAG: hypothetical protein UR16_C0001G0136 [Candidatus Woesebacteria bacterium GW2011_GWB1_31_29]KKP32216.1 MAG: hypothetical protein UR21_C0001G0012 [Candidatus Woesebacteria bacterium GW2011_GWC2_31_9]KKP33672.1 MAG: hypothetical protein UR24_C0003G0170 [Candidatus Woesebacteria b